MKRLKLLTIIAAILLCTSCLASCATVKKSKFPMHHDSFTFVMQSVKIEASGCYTEDSSKVLSREDEVCQNVLAQLPMLSYRATGSGVIVANGPGVTYVVTAGHVCEPPKIPKRVKSENVVIETRVTNNITIQLFSGAKLTSTIVDIDSKNDLCLLRLDRRVGKVARVSHRELDHGEKVYSLAAPYGMFEPGMVLAFEGRYSGIDLQIGFAFFTVPAQPGSSGSAVVDSDGNVVGIVVAASRVFEHVGLAVPGPVVYRFVKLNGVPGYQDDFNLRHPTHCTH
jgi:S1-C subfamily serine protease